jgi:chemotaxis protein CheZ
MPNTNSELNSELVSLFSYITRLRQEIASINRGTGGTEQFKSMGDQLDAIVEATEEATNTIMESMESNEKAITELRAQITDPAQIKLLDQINDNGGNVFQACAFQDITGQRVSKIVKSVIYVEERVQNLVDIWGKEELDKLEVEEIEETEDEKLLRGPKLNGQEALDQNDIDSLFD